MTKKKQPVSNAGDGDRISKAKYTGKSDDPAAPAEMAGAARADLRTVAARLAGVAVTELLAVGLRADGSLAVVVKPGPKYVYDPAQVRAVLNELAQ